MGAGGRTLTAGQLRAPGLGRDTGGTDRALHRQRGLREPVQATALRTPLPAEDSREPAPAGSRAGLPTHYVAL